MALTAAQIESIRASLAAEPFTRQSVVGTAEERARSAGYARGISVGAAGAETQPIYTSQPLDAPDFGGVAPETNGVMVSEPVQATGMETSFNGIETDGIEADLGGAVAPAAIPTAFPLVAGAIALSVAALRRLLITYGPKLLKAMIGVAAFKELMDILTGKTWGTDDTQIPIKPGEPGRKRRYSIGHNPRVRTLQRVSRHCLKLIKRHDKVIREFLPKRQGMPARALARTYLSPAERQQLKG